MSQSQAKKNKKRKPKAVSQSRPSRKLDVNKNEIEVKNAEEEDSSATVIDQEKEAKNCVVDQKKEAKSCMKRWTICDENRRTSVLKSCNEKWRTYKKSITRKISTNNGDPRETWTYLEDADLEIFRQWISTDEFQVISEKAKASSQHNTNPAKVGPHGYRGNKLKWEQEMASGELEPQLYEIKSERGRDYVMGRRSKNASGSKTIPPSMKPIVNKMVEVQAQISKGDVVPGPGEDLLTMVIGPEHPGRTRAVGHDVGLRIGMQGTEKKKRKTFHDKESEAISYLKATLDIGILQCPN
ncbi:hypothetical protein LXL04_008624 [Taraxacum kok-saghyz]